MITYFAALAKDFASDANVWIKKYHVFYFVVVSALEQGKIVYNIASFIYTY